MTPRPPITPTSRAYSAASAVVMALLIALCVASGFTAGRALSNGGHTVHTWGP